MRLLLRLFLLSSVVLVVQGDECVARCERLHQRSIQRIGFDGEKVARLLEKQRPAGTLRDICWRLFDKLDCLKRCSHDKETEKYGRDVRFKCKGVLGELAGQLKCVSRYRSFIQIKCSTFLKEAVSSRVMQAVDTVPDKDTCRYLHLNSLCLENTVGNYCPSATAIFRRLNFRDYFLNFIIPEDDRLFDDVDLDSCQIYDFVKSVHKPSPSLEEEDDELTTIVNQWEDEEMTRRTEPVTTTTESTTTTRERERQEFTTLLNELLDSSTESNEITVSGEEITALTRVTPTENRRTSAGEDVAESISVTTADKTLEMAETTGSSVIVTETEGTSPSYTKKTVLLKEDLVTPADVTTTRASTIPQSSSSVITNRVTTDKSVEEEPETSTLIEIPSNKRKVFSDDSMENTPPNFFYSSARYRTSTLSANHGTYYSSTERDKEIVRPVEVDTSTLFGDDFSQGAVEIEPVPWTTTKAPEVIIPTPATIPIKYTPMTAAPKTTTRVSVTYRPKSGRGKGNRGRTTPKPGEVPLLNGGQVVVKSIKRWGEPESDEEIREVEKIQRSPVVDEEELDKIMGRSSEQYDYVEEVTTRDASSSGRLTENEILIFIYLVLCALALVALICVLLFCICCRQKSSPNFNKRRAIHPSINLFVAGDHVPRSCRGGGVSLPAHLVFSPARAMSYHVLSHLPLQIHLQVLSKMGSKSICRMRRTCHFYDSLISTYYKQMRNVIRIERLGFSIMLPDATDWKNVVIITNQFHNTYYGLPLNFQLDDLCRLQIRTLDLFIPDEIPMLLEDALRALDGRVRVRELECKMTSYSEEMFEYIMTKIRPLEVCLNWPAGRPVPCRDFLRNRALESVARLELMSSVDNLDLSRCHPSLLHLKIQNYRVDDAAEGENLLLQVTEAMEKTNLHRIHITVTSSVYTTTSSRCWIELKSDRCILYSIIGSGSAVTIYSIREKTDELADLEKIKMEIDECIRVSKEPPYDKIDADRDEHEDTILSHYTTFSEESFNCSSISSDRSILSDSLSS